MAIADKTRTLAKFAAELRADDIPPEVIHQGERLILDTCCCAIAGYALDNGKKFAQTMLAMGGVPEATFFGTGARCPAPVAAFLNTQLANVGDLDDNLLYHTHFANTAVLPAFAIGEKERASGIDLVTSVIAAFEVTSRITLSMPGILRPISKPPSAKFEWPRPFGGSYNVFGAAAGAGRVMKLDANAMANALGIAGYTATVPTASKAFVEAGFSDMKYTAYGWLAWSGVLAALMAKDGITADQRVLDGPDGFWRMMGAQSCDFEMLTRDLGKKWWILDTSIKPYPAGTWMRNSMMVLERIVRKHDLKPDEIAQVTVHTWLLKESGPAVRKSPESYLDTQVSYPYLLAMIALRMPPNRWHAREVYSDPAVLRMMHKIQLTFDPQAGNVIYEEMQQWHGRTRKAPARVVVQARGETYEDQTEFATGDPFDDATRLTDDDLADKFRLYAGELIRKEHVERAVDMLLSASKLKDVAEVARFLRP